MDIGLVLTGFSVGALVGLTGVGGASLLTPVLIWLGIQPSIAVGTDMFYNAVTKGFGTWRHKRKQTIDWPVVCMFAIGSIPASLLGISVLHSHFLSIGADGREHWIRILLGVVLILAALAILFNALQRTMRTNGTELAATAELEPYRARRRKGVTILFGAALGFLVGLTSVGSGALFAIVLLYLYRMSAARIVGTDVAHAFVLTAASSLFHAGFGSIDYPLAFQLLAGSIPGVWLGSGFVSKVPAHWLRLLVACLVLFSGIHMMIHR